MAAADDAVNAFIQAMQSRKPTAYQLPAGLEADSAYLAFLRGAGVGEDDAWAQANTAIQNLHRQYATAGESMRVAGEQERENVGKEHLTRNTYRSGERLEDLARQRALEERGLAELNTDFAGQISTQQAGLNSRLAALQREHGEQATQLYGRSEERKRQAQLDADARRRQDEVAFGQVAATWTPEQRSNWFRMIGQPEPPQAAWTTPQYAQQAVAPSSYYYPPADPNAGKTPAQIMQELYNAGVRGPTAPPVPTRTQSSNLNTARNR